jgi:hypothetical protein
VGIRADTVDMVDKGKHGRHGVLHGWKQTKCFTSVESHHPDVNCPKKKIKINLDLNGFNSSFQR